jgi:hypothetical protein
MIALTPTPPRIDRRRELSNTHGGERRVQQPGLRYYSSELGRWVSKDPVSENGFRVGRRQGLPSGILQLGDGPQYLGFRNAAVNHLDPLGLLLLYPGKGTVDVAKRLAKRCRTKCGTEVTREQFRKGFMRMLSQFRALPEEGKKANCEILIHPFRVPVRASTGWDLDLATQWKSRCQTEECGGFGCGETIWVDDDCREVWSANYLQYGWMARICNGTFGAPDLKAVHSIVDKWRRVKEVTAPLIGRTLGSGPREFAEKGWYLWPLSGGSLGDAGLREGCQSCGDVTKFFVASVWPDVQWTPQGDVP